MKWASIDLLLEENNLVRFVELAKQSDWLPHYYNTLYLFMSGESNDKKKLQVFENIVDIITLGDVRQNYRLINKFIENAFKDDVEYHFKQMFLKFIREKL